MLKNLFVSLKKLKQTRVTTKLALVIFVFITFVLVVTMPLGVKAVSAVLDFVFSPILDLLMAFVGGMVSLVLSILVSVAQFNEFTTATAVTTGWVLVRDICNMFFIVILLIISVGTVLGIQSYSYKNFLKKVILMAILINFSKTIAGFLIDVSQIIMLTFVAAFKDSIIVGFAEAFGINKLKSMSTSMDASGATSTDHFATLLGMILGLVFSVIFLLVLVSVVVMLVYRIVILWILVVLSPFAYLASAMPGSLGGQAKQWWSQFSEQLIVGPAIAFFLWLSLSVVSATGGKFTNENITSTPSDLIGGSLANASFILNYIIGIVLLVVGMQMAQKMGGKSGAAMGKTFEGAKKYGWKGVKGVRSAASWGKDAIQDKLGGGREERLKKLEQKKDRGGFGGVWAARSIDTLKARDKSRKEFQGGMLKKAGFGDNAFEALDVIANSGLKKAQDEARANAGATALEELATDPGKMSELQKAEKADQVIKAEEGARKQAEKDWEGFSEAKKNSDEYGGNRKKYLDEQAKIAGDKVKEKDLSEFSKAAENKYVTKRGKEAADKAKEDYLKESLSMFNPLKPALDYATDQGKFKKDAEQSREALIASPGSLTENRFIDKEGKAKEGSIKTILGQMSQPEIQNLVNHWTQEEAKGTKDADKVLANLLTGLKVASDKNLSPAAAAVYSSLPGGLKVQRLGKSETLSEIKPVKSKEYLTDIDESKVLNTAAEIENEINYLGDTEVKAGEDDGGWEVDREKSINGKIALKKEGEEQIEVDKDVFMKHNGSLLADHFYNSDRYERLKSDKGEDSLLSREDYNTHARIKDSSQEGVSLGSFGQGSDWTAVDYDRFNEVTGNLVGDSKAGVTVQGDDAIKAAEGMEIMIDDQVYELENAKTDDELKGALSKFGYNDIKDGADLDEIKQKALKDAEMAKERLKDKDKIAEEGLIIINKQRGAREIRSTLRHERAHKLIESVDKDGTIQNEVWDRMSPEEQEEAREYIRKDRNQPDMDESEIRTEYIADAFANARKPGGAKEGAPKLPPALADRLSNSDKMKLDDSDVGTTEIKTGFITSRLVARKARKQREADMRLEDEKKKITAEWEDNKEENLAAVRAKTGNENLTEEEAKQFFMTPKLAKAEEKAKVSMQKTADKYKAKTAKKRAKIDKKKKEKEEAYNATEEEMNNVRTKFAQRYNTRQEGQRKLNKDAQLLQQEAQEALAAGDEKGYLTKLDEARNKTKQAQVLARENISDKKDYDKQIESLNKKAVKGRKETNIKESKYDDNVWNDAMSGGGKLGKIFYSAGGRQTGLKSVADLTLHGLAKVGIAKNLAAKTSDTYKYEMQKRQVNLEKGQFAEIFTELDGVVKTAMDNPGGVASSQKVMDKRNQLMKQVDESKSMSAADKAKFKERIGGVIDDMIDGKGSTDSQRFTKANELMNAYMKTKVSGASIAKDALNGALIMATGGLGSGVATARMALFAGTNMMDKINQSKANYIKEGRSGSRIGNIVKDLTIGSARESYNAIAHGQGFKGKAIGALGAVAKLSTAYSISAGLTDSDQFIDAFTQSDVQPSGGLFEHIGQNLVTNAKAVGARYANMPERLKSLLGGAEASVPATMAGSLSTPIQSQVAENIGDEFVANTTEPSVVEQQIVDQINHAEAVQKAAFDEEIKELMNRKLTMRDVPTPVSPIEYMPYKQTDFLVNPSEGQLVDRGLPAELAKRIDNEVGSTGANSVQFMDKFNKDGSGERTVQWVNNSGQTQTEIYSKTGPQIKIGYDNVPVAPERDYSEYAKMSEQVRSETLSEVYGNKGLTGDISKLVASDGWHSGNGNLKFSDNELGRHELAWTDKGGITHKYEYDDSGKIYKDGTLDNVEQGSQVSAATKPPKVEPKVTPVVSKNDIDSSVGSDGAKIKSSINDVSGVNPIKVQPEVVKAPEEEFKIESKLTPKSAPEKIPTQSQENVNLNGVKGASDSINESSLSGVTPIVNTGESTVRVVEGLKNNDSSAIEFFVGGTDMASRKQLVDKLNNIVNDNTIPNEDKITALNNIKNELVDRIKMNEGNTRARNEYLSMSKNIDKATNNIEHLSAQSTTESVAPITPKMAPRQSQDNVEHKEVYTTSAKVDFDHMNDSTINALAKGDKEIINQAFGESEYKAGSRIVYIVEKVVNDDKLSLEQKTSIMNNLKEEFVKRNIGNEGQREYRAVMDRLKPAFWRELRKGS